jgi:hypothetical protein
MVRSSRMRRFVAAFPRSVAAGLAFAALAAPDALAQQTASDEAPDEASAKLEKAREVRREGNVEGIESQHRIDEISDQTDSLFSRYRTALREVDAIAVYNSQMEDLISSQEREIRSLEDQLGRVDLVSRSVMPLMLRMIDALDAFVRLDVPFLLDERSQRIQSLREMMARADITNAEKFRAIMEAYQVENEFGRTIEAYRSTLDRDGKEMTVDFLRFGRIALVYQTLDGNESGVWDQASRSWKPLDDSYRGSIREGLRIARKQSAPDLIRLPVPTAQSAEEAG